MWLEDEAAETDGTRCDFIMLLPTLSARLEWWVDGPADTARLAPPTPPSGDGVDALRPLGTCIN